jgi:hypothetical protein
MLSVRIQAIDGKRTFTFLDSRPCRLLQGSTFISGTARCFRIFLAQPRVGSPASSVIRSTPTSCRPSRVASFPSLRGTVAAPWASLPQPHDATAAGLGLFIGLPKTGFIDGDDRTSQVPGGPHYERALLFDPGWTVRIPFQPIRWVQRSDFLSTRSETRPE